MHRKPIAFILCLALVAALAGCSGAPAEKAGATHIFIDSCGREVTVPAAITKIAPAGVIAQLMLYSLAPDKLVGLTGRFTEEAKLYMDDKYKELPAFGQFYGKNANLNMEALAAAAPEVIIDIGEAKKTVKEDMDALQEQIGIPVVFIEMSLATTADAYVALGELLGEQAAAKKLADYCAAAVADAQEKSAAVAEDGRLTVYYGEGADALVGNPAGSIHAEILEFVGAVNVVDAEFSSGGGQISAEQILLWNPDVILLGQDVEADAIAADGSPWRELDAVKSGKTYVAPYTPYNWLGRPPSVNRILGVKWLGNLLYPELYDYDMVKEVKDFYSLFYHYDLTDEQAADLLKR